MRTLERLGWLILLALFASRVAGQSAPPPPQRVDRPADAPQRPADEICRIWQDDGRVIYADCKDS